MDEEKFLQQEGVKDGTPEAGSGAGAPIVKGNRGDQPPVPDAAGESEALSEEAGPDTDRTRIEVLVAEAEQRGYLRGRNESIESLMSSPGMYEHSAGESQRLPSSNEVLILNNLRPSVWD